MQELEAEIKSSGYSVYAAKSPKGLGSIHAFSELKEGEKTGMGYGVFIPKNEQDPIIIAYRGTENLGDFKEDIALGVKGVATKAYRDEAYAAYEQVRKEFPNRTIVLAGHSLGGNLATYVGVKASHLNKDEENLHVRTFNAAGSYTIHQKEMVSAKKPIIAPNMFHYRLYNDQVGKMSKIGNCITYIGKEQRLISPLTPHIMKNVMADISPEVKNIKVGGCSPVEAMKEAILGLQSTYSCRNKSQYRWPFSDAEVKMGHINFMVYNAMKIINNQEYSDEKKLSEVYKVLTKYKNDIDRMDKTHLSFSTVASQQMDLLLKRCQQYQTGPLKPVIEVEMAEFSKKSSP